MRHSAPPIFGHFAIDWGFALRVCRPALAIEERLESMEMRIAVMEEAISAPLPTKSGSIEPGSSRSGPSTQPGASIPPRGGLYLSGCPLITMEPPIG